MVGRHEIHGPSILLAGYLSSRDAPSPSPCKPNADESHAWPPKFMIAKLVHQAPVPPMAPRSNPKPDQNPTHPSPKHAQPITTKSGTCHDSFTVATCAKPYRSRQSTFRTRSSPSPGPTPNPTTMPPAGRVPEHSIIVSMKTLLKKQYPTKHRLDNNSNKSDKKSYRVL